MGSLFTAERSRRGDLVLVPEGRVGSIVPEKNHEGFLGHAERFEMVEEVAE